MFKHLLISLSGLILVCSNVQADYQYSSAVYENFMKHLAAREIKVEDDIENKVKKQSSKHFPHNKRQKAKESKPLNNILPNEPKEEKNPVEIVKPTPSTTPNVPHTQPSPIIPQETHKKLPSEMTPIITPNPVILEKPAEEKSISPLSSTVEEKKVIPKANPSNNSNAPVSTLPEKPVAPVKIEKKLNEESKSNALPSLTTSPANLTLYYQPGEFELNEELKSQLLTMIKQHKDQRIKVIGFASHNNDSHQSAARRISLQRVISIRKFLITNNFNSALITVQAMGHVQSSLNPERVEIYVEKD